MKAKFITFEGVEGSGKTTQSKLLYEALKTKDIKVLWTREPGGTEQGEKIRNLLMQNTFYRTSELLIFMAARFEHVKQLIEPALKNGVWVICDRFIDSSICYQAYDQGNEGIKYVLALHEQIFGKLYPDITFFIDVPFQLGLKRARKRGKLDKYEKFPKQVHQKIFECYQKLIDIFPARIKVIDGVKEEKDIHKEIKNLCI